MKEFRGKYNLLLEQTLYRYQQGGFLRGDYVKLKSGALQGDGAKHISSQVRELLEASDKQDTYWRISYIKSGQSEAFNGPVDAANIPAAPLYADIIHEYAPGMWKDPVTLPLDMLEKIEVEPQEGYAPYPKSLVRPNDNSNKEATEVDQTDGKDAERKLHNKNEKVDTIVEPITSRPGVKRINENRDIMAVFMDSQNKA